MSNTTYADFNKETLFIILQNVTHLSLNFCLDTKSNLHVQSNEVNNDMIVMFISCNIRNAFSNLLRVCRSAYKSLDNALLSFEQKDMAIFFNFFGKNAQNFNAMIRIIQI